MLLSKLPCDGMIRFVQVTRSLLFGIGLLVCSLTCLWAGCGKYVPTLAIGDLMDGRGGGGVGLDLPKMMFMMMMIG